MLGWSITVYNEPENLTWDEKYTESGELMCRVPRMVHKEAFLGWNARLGGLDIFEHPECELLAPNGGYPLVYRAPAWMFEGETFTPPEILRGTVPGWFGESQTATCIVFAWDQS